MSAEGTKGGDQRPASNPEVKKLPVYQCGRCGIRSVSAVVEPSIGTNNKGFCRNTVACAKRVERGAKNYT